MHQLRLATAAMGTRFELVLFTAEPERHRAAAEAAIDEIEAAHRRYTRFAPDSLVSHINRTAAHTPVRLDKGTYTMLEDALRVELESRGAFSITSTPSPPPSPSPRPGFALSPDDRSITLLHDEAKIDLGAIAKGHALDLAAALLREHGVTCALLHGGTSSVVAIGAPPGEDGWRVALGPEPHAPTVTLRDAALGVSATTERPHIVDPRTGAPAPPNRRAAVVGPGARLADAWSTALVVLGERPRALGAEWTTFIDDLGGDHAEGPSSHRDAESLLTRSRGGRGVGAGPGCALRGAERSSPGSTFMMNGVSSGGIHAHPAAEGAGRGRLHPANSDSPGANHHKSGSLSTPRGLRSATGPETTLCALRDSAPSAPPREPMTPRVCVGTAATQARASESCRIPEPKNSV